MLLFKKEIKGYESVLRESIVHIRRDECVTHLLKRFALFTNHWRSLV